MNLQGQTLDIYELGDELGRGGMGVVHRAVTSADSPAGPAGSVVAVKIFHPQLVADEGAVERFRREAEIGREIDHPNVVRTYDAGRQEIDGEACHYMVMEFVDGQTLDDLRHELGTLPDHLLFHVADQALGGLSAIHALGVVHRDMKPENVVITTNHDVLLMDLGVARMVQAGHTLTQHGDFVGSLVYAAPEQFDHSAPISPASDVYAFGIVLWELATGSAPFDAKDLPGLLRQKLRETLPRPKESHADLDAFWDEVIATCTARHPDDRFESAVAFREILAEGRKGAWWRDRTSGRSRAAEQGLERLRVARDTPHVGRDREIEALREAYRTALDGRGGVALVGGAAGSGKSRLAFEMAVEIADGAFAAIRVGRAAGPGGRAYQPFLEVLHDLLGIDEMAPEERHERVQTKLAGLLPDTPGVVGPIAEFLLAGVRHEGASGLEKDALLSSVANVLRRSAADAPLVVVIEDLHLAGSESLDLFAYLARCVAGHPIFLVGVYNDEEIAEGSALSTHVSTIASSDGGLPLALRPLSPTACDELIRAHVGLESTVRGLSGVIRRQGDGNPFVIGEMIARLKERGDLLPEGDGLTLARPIDEIDLPSKVAELIALRLAGVDDDERETLEAAAVLGHEFDSGWLATILEERRIKLLKRLAVLERKHRLIRSSGRDSFRFAKRSIRDALYQELPEALREEYHSMAADAIRESSAAPEDLASIPASTSYQLCGHLISAQRSGEVAPWAEAAANHVTGTYDAAHAAHFVEQLVTAVEGGDERTLFRLSRRQWDAYEALGRRAEQVEVLERSRRLAESLGDASLAAQVHCLLGVTGWRTGRNEDAEREARLARDLAREAGDREWEANALQTLGAVVRLGGDFTQCAEFWREALEIREEIGDRAGEARSLASLGAVMPEIGEKEGALDAKRRALQIFQELGHRRGQCAMLNNIGKSLVDDGRHDEAVESLHAAVEMASELGDLVAEAYPLYNLGRTHAAAGRVAEAKESLERALELFREAGVPGGQFETIAELAHALEQFGDLDGAIARLRDGLALASTTGSAAAACRFRIRLGDLLHCTGLAEEGDAEFEQAVKLTRDLESPRLRFDTLLVRGRVELEAGRADVAVGCFEAAARAADDAHVAGAERTVLAARTARAQLATNHIEEAMSAVAALDATSLAELPEQREAEAQFTLWQVLGADDRRAIAALDRAKALIAEHADRLSDPEVRKYYLERTWLARAVQSARAGR